MHLDKNLESIVNREAILPKSNAQFLDDQSQDPSQSQDHKIKNDLLPQKQINKIVDHPVMLGEQENQQLKNGFSEKSNSNLIEVKQGNRKKVIILSSVGILIAIGLIFGGLAIGGVFSSQSIVEKMNYNKQVKLPESYVKFEQQINIGQEKNILQLIQVPLSQKIYEYKLENEQITTTGDGKVTSKKSVITHTFNYLCYQISNIEFDMYLYFTSTVISENDQVQSTLTGYPAILEKEKANNIRNIEDNVQKSQQTQDDTSKQVNEYAPLTAQEIKLLQEKGISEEQFNFSKYPIVRFTLSKEGEIKKIYEPINLRNDLQQIYLNIIEQLSPLLRKDLYNIFETDKETGKKRILKNASESYKYRNLNNVEVTPQHEAEISDDGKGVLKSTEPEVSENGNQQGEYSQECTIENGSLLRSSVSSKFTIKGNQEDSTSMFKQIDNISAVIIQYIDWEHKVDETFVQNLIQIQQKMSYFIMTKQQVLDKRAKSYLKPKENPNSVISDDSKGRVLVGIDENRNLVFEEQPKNNDNFQEPKPMGEVIQQSIFRKNFESIDFGADIKSECIESGFYSSEDVCTVGLYGYFNGSMTKIIERQTKINVSRLLKLNWYIQHVLVEKMGSVEKYVNSKLDGIVQKVNAILDQLELLLDINKNPVLKVINDAIQNDQFEIMDSINGFEQTINKSIKSINGFVKDPLGFFKEKVFAFLSSKGIQIEDQIKNIKKFFTDKLSRIKNFLVKNRVNGISQKIKEKIQLFMQNYQVIIAQILEEPIKKLLQSTESFILQKANELFENTLQIDKQVDKYAEEIIQKSEDKLLETKEFIEKQSKITKQMKKMLSTSFVVDKLKDFIKNLIKKITSQYKISELLQKGLQSAINLGKNQILSELQNISTKNQGLQSLELDQILKEANEIVDFAHDFYSGIKDLKKDITYIVNSFKKIQQKEILDSVKTFTSKLVSYPKEIAKTLKEKALSVLNKIKTMGLNMKQNIFDWKDQLVKLSKDLWDEIKGIFEEIKNFATKPKFPPNDPSYYKEPIFTQVLQVVNSLKSVSNLKFTQVLTIFDRLKLIPSKFMGFIEQIKEMGLSTFKYWDRVKLAFNNVKMEGQTLWSNIKSRADEAKEFFENQFKKKIALSSEQKGRLLFQETQRQLDGSIDINKLDFGTVFGQVQDVASNFQTEGLAEVINNVSNFKNQVEQQTENSGGLIQKLIKEIISKLEFSKSFPSQTRKIPVDYAFTYNGKIAKFKLVLNAQWEVSFNTGVSFKNGLLDFKAGVNTKVSVSGNISFGISIGEVGGTAEGTFLNTQVQVGLGLKVLEKFAGQVYVDGSFSPYAFKIGAYLNLSLQKENKICGKNNKRYLGTGAKKTKALETAGSAASSANKNQKGANAANKVQKVVNSANKAQNIVNSATNSAKEKAIQEAKKLGSGSITNVKSAVQDIVGGDATTLVKNQVDTAKNVCQVTVDAIPKIDYIFGPYEFIGETYKKRLLDKSWNGYNQSKDKQ